MEYQKLITKEEAARILMVKPSTIGRYWRKGRLSWKVINKKRRCIYEEIVAFKEQREQISPTGLRDEVIRLKYRVGQLEYQLQILEGQKGILSQCIYGDNDLVTLYDRAKGDDPRRMRLDTLESWKEVLNALTENDLSRLKSLTKDTFPWAVFIHFIDKTLKNLKRRREYRKSTKMQGLFYDFQFIKDRIQTRAKNVFIEEGERLLPRGKTFIDTITEEVDDKPLKVQPLSKQRF